MDDPRLYRILTLSRSVLRPSPGIGRILSALAIGGLCHLLFALSVLAMMAGMFHGMSKGMGSISWPWAAATNGLLILQFPLVHSWLLSGNGSRFLAKLFPGQYGSILSTTSYATIASIQLLALFVLWTPTGIVWWKAEGIAFYVLCSAYACSWLLLAKASFDAGLEVQSGALGWMSMPANIRPIFPDMPVLGLFRYVRHPIYGAFILTLWTVPTWTPDQLIIAICLTAYCLIAPLMKESRFEIRHGSRFRIYRKKVPYIFPRLLKQTISRRPDSKVGQHE
ncbi:MAG: isoprenylcysteine carboxylmethyltransferase family protein [Pseudomonadota bacterium]